MNKVSSVLFRVTESKSVLPDLLTAGSMRVLSERAVEAIKGINQHVRFVPAAIVLKNGTRIHNYWWVSAMGHISEASLPASLDLFQTEGLAWIVSENFVQRIRDKQFSGFAFLPIE